MQGYNVHYTLQEGKKASYNEQVQQNLRSLRGQQIDGKTLPAFNNQRRVYNVRISCCLGEIQSPQKTIRREKEQIKVAKREKIGIIAYQ